VEKSKARRDLNKNEQEALFSLYCKHNGNCSAVGRDENNKYHRNIVLEYAKRYGFENIRLKKVAKEAEQFKKDWSKKLKEGKMKAIEKAMELLDTKTYNRVDKNNDIVEITSYPDGRDIKTAYEILKIELGEPTTISKNMNVDETEVEKALNILKNGIEQDNTQLDKTVQDRREASDANTDTTEDLHNDNKEKAQEGDNDTSNPVREIPDSSTGGNS